MGERTPYLDASARGAWIGLTAKHQRADLVRAILEGVCFSQKDGLEIINGLGARPDLVRLSGGGAKSPFWHQLFADIFNERVVTLETQEGSAYGAALLALVGTGEYSTVVEVCRKALHETETKEPTADAADFYKRRYTIYRSLYPALKSAFAAIGELDG
jgi:xylulokinase